jgi:formate/nitrite transporter FocA (FNT family)
MAQEEKSRNVGTVLLTILAGAVLGAGIAFLVASQKEQSEDTAYDEADLFV